MSPPVFEVQSREQALRLRELCGHVEILIPRHVTITGGPLFVAAFIEGFAPPPWVDCAHLRGHALGLIRNAIPRLIFDAPPEVFAKIEDMGRQVGTFVVPRLQAPLFVLRADELSAKVLGLRLRQAGLLPP